MCVLDSTLHFKVYVYLRIYSYPACCSITIPLCSKQMFYAVVVMFEVSVMRQDCLHVMVMSTFEDNKMYYAFKVWIYTSLQ